MGSGLQPRHVQSTLFGGISMSKLDIPTEIDKTPKVGDVENTPNLCALEEKDGKTTCGLQIFSASQQVRAARQDKCF